jgi:putative hydrolases of HD superfamily
MRDAHLHHVQLAMPPGGEPTARRFFGDLLGMPEVDKPPALAARGGVWFRAADLEIHLGVDEDFAPATKAHPAILVDDLDAVAERLAAAGHDVRRDDLLPGFERFHTDDPFGNRIEFVRPVADVDRTVGAEGSLDAQLAFLLEADRLKRVRRRTTLADGSRRENSAEHSWHLALFALALAEHAAEEIDVWRVVHMVLVHDLVEIDAGDTFAYDEAGRVDQAERERTAADRIFALLPEKQAASWRAVWDEFEAQRTPEARFARAIDRLQPILLNFASRGVAWRAHGIDRDRVVARNRLLIEQAPALWGHVSELLDAAVERGYLAP